ncbi:YeeE/YedE thiosulfate transporter family protein [Novosphingobium sp. KCTC 2891]|uniref:YeeE/YedE family protein n=1 Tax=Novosphingobium sp. KCTC 2891 TaxID=2989730 RepID=UPI002222CB9B|nr:YeeE/YedE thiosulfate transporter family protein [Novosphingobium sp. KCTC 2891]MCW1384073.1 YeeE/YedE thiosulfate transporter family protein [Novosphingobium sp. KCTC 2891]
MSSFLHPLLGGLLIGSAAGGLRLANGSIAGISGIFGTGLLRREGGWQRVFLLGLIAAALAWLVFLPADRPPQALLGYPLSRLVAAGLLVGAGTALGNGCTSGHGVCGLARLSLRSLFAVAVFMATAEAVVWLDLARWLR